MTTKVQIKNSNGFYGYDAVAQIAKTIWNGDYPEQGKGKDKVKWADDQELGIEWGKTRVMCGVEYEQVTDKLEMCYGKADIGIGRFHVRQIRR